MSKSQMRKFFISLMLLLTIGFTASLSVNPAWADDSTGSISGRVTRDSDGTGISGIQVNVCAGFGNILKGAQTDSTGNYNITGLVSGYYFVQTSNGLGFIDEYYDNATFESNRSQVHVTAGSLTTGINFGLAAGGGVAGRVTRDSDGTGISGVTVYAYYCGLYPNFAKTAQTDSTGNYSITGLAANCYYIKTSNTLGFTDEFYDNSTHTSPSSATAVGVTVGNTTTGINFGLTVPGRITGRVTRDSDGMGVSGVGITVYNSSYNFTTSTGTDASGNYTVTGLATGSYYLATSNSSGLIDECYNNSNSLGSATAVSVSVNSITTGINIALADPGSITGRVTRNTDGTGISGVGVIAGNSYSDYVSSTTTDESGNYTITGLAADNYSVRTTNSSGFIDEYYDNTTSKSSATAVNITAGNTTAGINFGLAALGSITGRLTNDSDGTGISGVYVNANGPSGSSSSLTDASGNYTISRLQAGRYVLQTSNNLGFIDEFYNNAASQSLATYVTVNNDSITTGIDFGLTKYSSVSGRVTRDSDGTGISGASVTAYTVTNGSWSFVKSATTDASGNYTISKLTGGNIYLLASSSSYQRKYYNNATSQSQATAVKVVAGATTSGVNFSLLLGGSITGRVTRASDGAPISQLMIYAYDATWNPYNSAMTDSNGNYSMSGLPSGSFYIGLSPYSLSPTTYAPKYYPNSGTRGDALRVAVLQGVTTPNIDLQLAQGRSISGRVVRESDGSGISGVSVSASYTDDHAGWRSSQNVNATTDSQGYYALQNLSPRKYVVSTSNSQGYVDEIYNNAAATVAATPVEVLADADTTNIDFSLAQGGFITGKVTVDSSTGAGVSQSSVIVYDTNWDEISIRTTDSSGNYRIGALKPGNYYVGMSGSSLLQSEVSDKYYNDSVIRSGATPVTVAPNGETSNINFIIPSGGSVSGKVVRSLDQTPISGVMVKAWDNGWKQIKSAITDDSGNYQITGLAPGKYYVGYNDKSYTDQYSNQTAMRNKAATVTVRQGLSTSGIDFSLMTMTDVGSISGKILANSDGASLPGTGITVYNGNWEIVKSGTADTSGNYSISGIPAGNYYVGVFVYYYENRYYNGSTGSLYPDGATTISIMGGENTPDINFGLNPVRSLEGYVFRSSDGEPISQVYVDAYNDKGEIVSHGRTEARGYYSITGLTPGQYFLRTRNNLGYADEYYRNALTQETATPVSLIEESISLVPFRLSGGNSISGRVTRGTEGAGLAGVKMIAHDANWTQTGFAITDASGNYSIEGLPPGSYNLKTSNNAGWLDEYYDGADSQSSATVITLTAGQTVTDMNLNLPFGGSITGTVKRDSDSTAMANATIGVFDANWNTLLGVPTDADGNYSITGLAAGDYYLVAVVPNDYLVEYYNNAYSQSAATKVAVTLGTAITGINFGITGIGSISGRITDSAGGSGLSNIEVQVYDSGWNMVKSVTTDSGGYYNADRIPAGSYYLRTSNNAGYIDRNYGSGSLHYQATIVTVAAAADTGNINIVLSQGSGAISGNIVDDFGLSLAGITVIVYKTSDSDLNIVETAVTDANGNFILNGLAPDDYFIKTANNSGYINEYYGGGTSSTGATPISIASGVTTNISSFGLGQKNQSRIDFNNDRKSDILWRNAATGEILAWIMNGADHVNEAPVATFTDNNWKIAGLADFTGDSKSDILWRNQSTGKFVVWYMDGANKIGEGPADSLDDLNWIVAGVADFNDDDLPDILWRNVSTGENLVWYMLESSHTNSATIASVPDPDWHIAGVGDFNKDKKTDILWRNISTGQNYVWYMNGPEMIGGAMMDSVMDLNWKIVSVGDYDGDGQSDIIWRNSATGDNNLWFMNGVTISSAISLDAVGDLNWLMFDKGGFDGTAKVSYDFNGDGKTDILWRNKVTGVNVLWYMNGETQIGVAMPPAVIDTDWTIAGTVDLNGDGKADIFWRNKVTGMNVLWYMNGETQTGVVLPPAVIDTDWSIAGTSDFNGDGKADILWRNQVTGVNVLWYMNGETQTGVVLPPAVIDTDWSIAGTSDFNGDGKADILWRNQVTGVNVLWYMNGEIQTGVAMPPTVTDTDWTIVKTGDFNGDGKADIFWRNTVTGVNVLWYMNGETQIGVALPPTVTDTDWTIER